MLSGIKRVVKSMIYKFANYYIRRDINFATNLVRDSFQNEKTREMILEEDVQKNSKYWLDLLKKNISGSKEIIKIAEEYLLLQDHFKKKVIEEIYHSGNLFDYTQSYLRKDLGILEKNFQVLSAEAVNSPAFYDFERKMLISLLNSVILGGISNCKYDSESMTFRIDGWFLPVNNYDKVIIEQSGKKLGEAILSIERKDVFENYPASAENYAGWIYQAERIQIDYDKEIVVQVYKKSKLVFSTRHIVEKTERLSIEKIGDGRLKETITIYKDGNSVGKIDVAQWKNCISIIENMGENIGTEKGDVWEIERMLSNIIDTRIPVKLTDGAATEEEIGYISNLFGKSNKNQEFYDNYLRNNNYKRVKADAEFISKYVSLDAEILDIGAVPPLLEEFLIQLGYKNLMVWDPNVEDFSKYFSQNNIRTKKINLFEIDVDEIKEKYDVVVFAEVLEHLTGNIKNVLEKVKKCVRKNGFVYLTTPNLRSISGMYGLFCKGSGLASKYRDSVMKQYERVEKNGYFGHIREYTDVEVVEIMNTLGFELVAKSMLPEFRKGNTLVCALEQFYPEYGLFGKYLFRKR